MIRHRVRLEIEQLPKTCRECPMFSCGEYRCHNERGEQGNCKMGYMRNADTRDFAGYKLWPGCMLGFDENVKVTPAGWDDNEEA